MVATTPQSLSAKKQGLPYREMIVVGCFALAAGLVVFDEPLGLSRSLGLGDSMGLGSLVQEKYRDMIGLVVSVQLFVAVPIIFTLERLYPAQPNVPFLSPAVAMDIIHAFIIRPLAFVVLALMSPPITAFLDANISWLVLDFTRELPLLVALAIGVIITDFFVWLTHVAKHKIPILWRFHVLHHAQEQLNMFSNARIHPMEHVQDVLMKAIPLFILFPSVTQSWEATAWLFALYATQQRFQHANIRTNLGPLRYLIVTPQSHRLHHSSVEAHWNSNYGSVFAWDRLFGMQHSDANVYPTTGLNDEEYPEPKSWSPGEFLRCIYEQLVYPFRRDALRRAEDGATAKDLVS